MTRVGNSPDNHIRVPVKNGSAENSPQDYYKNPLDAFLHSPKMKGLYDQAFQYSLELHSTREYEILYNTFKGAMIAELAQKQATEKKRAQDIIFDGDQTYQYFRRLYPNHKEVEFPFGVKTLQGIAVPDGMLLEKVGEETLVRGVYEYTSNPDLDNIRRKYNVFGCLKRDFPKIFGKSRVIFVVPNDLKLPADLLNKQDLGLIYLPFSGEQFHTFTQAIIYDGYRPNGATLYEVQKRRREQSHAGMVYEHSIPDLYPITESTSLTYTPLNYTPKSK